MEPEDRRVRDQAQTGLIVHRSSHLYVEVARSVRERIVGGEYTAGDRLPSEAGLCELYGVSRMTARRAVALLVRDGVVMTENGRGPS